MNKFLKAAAIAAVASVAAYGSANAGITTVFAGGTGAITPVAQNYNSGAVNDLFANIATVTSANAILKSGTDPSGADNPFSVPPSQYLSILAGGYVEITFIQALKSFSFDWGSRDSYNTLKIFTTSGGAIPFSIIPVPGTGDQGSALTNGRFTVNTTLGDGITAVRFETTQNSFEIDNLSGSVPEPATWAMMIMGFGLAGAAIRRRRHVLSVA